MSSRREQNTTLLDLTISNPPQLGFEYDASVYAALADPSVRTYAPSAFGSEDARAAIVRDHARRGVTMTCERLCLTASTSEGYAHVFSLVCDPGDRVLVPRPGYPLLGYLADLHGVELRHYPLVYDGAWRIDIDALTAQVETTPALAAIVVVAPNNPTGNYLHRDEVDCLMRLAAQRDVALIVDEVFADFPLTDVLDNRVTHLGTSSVPAFVLSGLSKSAALPQLKLGWIALHGPEAALSPIVERLEILADTYLSVNAAIQVAAPLVLEHAPAMRDRITQRTRSNLLHLRRRLQDSAVDVLHVDAGWTALLRMPRVDLDDDEAWARHLLYAHDTLVQPGHLFDLPGTPPLLAVSLLTEPAAFHQAVERIATCVQRMTMASGALGVRQHPHQC